MLNEELFNKVNYIGKNTVELIFPEPVSPIDHSNWETVISFCDEYNINGNKFAKFIYYCCDSKKEKVLLTIDAIRKGLICSALLRDNLNLLMPVAIIDETKPVYILNSRREIAINEEQKEEFMDRLTTRMLEEEEIKAKTTRPRFLKRIRKNK